MLDGGTSFWRGMEAIIRRDAGHRQSWPAGVVPRLGIGGLHFVDGPRGVILEGGATTFPASISRGACWDPELEERIGAAMGREARSFGANLFGGVCVNVLRHPGWGRAQETYGEDPLHVGSMGAALSRGVQRHAIACVKHFALNSIDSARFRVDVSARARVLHELYLPQFRACIEAGAMAVMSAYNSVNGQWCGQHPELLSTILKRRWGFRGFVLTDFIFGLRDGPGAVLAGLDLEMPFKMVLAASLAEAVAQGTVPISRIDDAVLRQLRAQLAVPAGDYPPSLRGCAAHRALAREAATKAIVLLRNQDAALPFSGLRSLAVLGRLAAVPNLGDHGSSDTRPASVLTPLEGLRAANPATAIRYDDGSERQRAAALAAGCEAAVVVVGLNWNDEGEHFNPGDIAPILQHLPPPGLLLRWFGRARLAPVWSRIARAIAAFTHHGSGHAIPGFAAGDRTELGLAPEQEALILTVAAANPRTVVVLMGGGAILCERWRLAVPAIVLLGYPGMEGGAALADVLFGQVSPSGRLPFSVPTDHDHLPDFDPRAQRITYDLWHGYRRLGRDGHTAAFPFGFGLSYVGFEHTDVVVTLESNEACNDGSTRQLKVELTVRNTGLMAADEVVQVYAGVPALAVERPRRMLVGFQRLRLEAGTAERVVVLIPLRHLAYFDEGRDAFVVEAGRHRLRVCRHVEDDGIGADLELTEMVLGR
ncbi:glycoside hydrolase family 3 C-terminal domain-containing protein [Cyanobium sp. ATX 6F1]|nr:glycoside hydrolase family 3 C-terminal domain-containing protein [Cyanobium sp. ATX 6F1]